jgi:hypothetical protein
VRAGHAAKDAPEFAAQDFLMQLAEGKADLDAIPEAPAVQAAAKARAKRADAAD